MAAKKHKAGDVVASDSGVLIVTKVGKDGTVDGFLFDADNGAPQVVRGVDPAEPTPEGDEG